jgi:transposase-like protein
MNPSEVPETQGNSEKIDVGEGAAMVGGLWGRCARLRQMKGHGAKFGRKQEEAIAALLTQRNIDEAATSIGIAPNTLLKWMKQPEFQAAYREARRDAYRQAIARLQQGPQRPRPWLLKTLIDANTPASVKVRAAEAIFNHAAKAIEIEDLDARLSALEAVKAEGDRRQ